MRTQVSGAGAHSPTFAKSRRGSSGRLQSSTLPARKPTIALSTSWGQNTAGRAHRASGDSAKAPPAPDSHAGDPGCRRPPPPPHTKSQASVRTSCMSCLTYASRPSGRHAHQAGVALHVRSPCRILRACRNAMPDAMSRAMLSTAGRLGPLAGSPASSKNSPASMAVCAGVSASLGGNSPELPQARRRGGLQAGDSAPACRRATQPRPHCGTQGCAAPASSPRPRTPQPALLILHLYAPRRAG